MEGKDSVLEIQKALEALANNLSALEAFCCFSRDCAFWLLMLLLILANSSFIASLLRNNLTVPKVTPCWMMSDSMTPVSSATASPFWAIGLISAY